MRHKLLSLFRPAPAPEVKSLAAPTPDLLEIFGALPSPGGVHVSTAQALQVPAVASCVVALTGAVAGLDLAVVRRDAEGNEDADPRHPVAALLARDPNEFTGWPELVADLLGGALIRDRGATAHVVRTGAGRIVEVLSYAPPAWTIDLDPVTLAPSYRLDNRQIDASDVIHVRSPLGRSPLSLAKDAIALATVMGTHAAQLFGRGARPSGTLMFQRGMAEDALKKSIAGWRAAHEGPDSSGKTAILHDGAEFKPLALSSTDAQFLELRKFQILEICRAFRVPPSMVYELDRATWSNTEAMGREFLTYSLEPWLRQIESALARALFSADERAAGYAVKFDRDDLTRADLQTRATTISSLIASRVLNANEGRAWLGLGPRDGGDTFDNPHVGERTGAAAPQEEKP